MILPDEVVLRGDALALARALVLRATLIHQRCHLVLLATKSTPLWCREHHRPQVPEHQQHCERAPHRVAQGVLLQAAGLHGKWYV